MTDEELKGYETVLQNPGVFKNSTIIDAGNALIAEVRLLRAEKKAERKVLADLLDSFVRGKKWTSVSRGFAINDIREVLK